MSKLKLRKFSEIKSDEDFRKYAHKVMKAAHGDEYSEEFTDKVVDDLLDDNKRATYGELIGRLTSGFGDKEFAMTGEPGLELTANGRRFRLSEKDKYEYNMWLKSKLKTTRILDQVFDGDESKYEEYMTKRGFSKRSCSTSSFSAEAMKSGFGNKTKEFSEEYYYKVHIDFNGYENNVDVIVRTDIDNARSLRSRVEDYYSDGGGTIDNIDIRSMDKDRYEELKDDYEIVKFSSTRSYSAEALESGVTFNLMPTDVCVCLPQLIGNLLLSVTSCHMYHLCTTDYAAHMALDEYYSELPELVDALAEHYIGSVAGGAIITLTVSITPGACPIEYLEALKAYCAQFSGEVASDYQSQIDAISEQIDSTLYKLKRLH